MKYKILTYLMAGCLILNLSCATGMLKVKYLENYDYSLLQEVSYTPADIDNAINRIHTLKEKIQHYSNQPDEKDYDEIIKQLTPIIEEYKKYTSAVNVINKDKGTIVIPPKTRLTLKLDTYCLSHNKASPSDDEPYVLVNETPEIPLYKEIMHYTNTKERVKQSLKQDLLWNLKNEVKFEDLPSEQQSLLLKVDSAAYIKVNNYLKELTEKEIGKQLDKYLPEIGKTKDAIEIVKGKVYTYQDYAQIVENLKSKYKKPSNDKPIKSEGYEIYVIVKAAGYSRATVTFINITDKEQGINSYFKPLRKDIQSLGFDVPDLDGQYNEYKKEFLSFCAYLLEYIGYIGPGDVKTIDGNPDKLSDIVIAFKDKRESSYRTKKEFGYTGTDDISDAFRHAYWNAIMTRDVGYDFAKEISENHELNPDNKNSIKMDLHNNQIGRNLGQKLKEQGILDNDSYAKEILDNINQLMQKPQE